LLLAMRAYSCVAGFGDNDSDGAISMPSDDEGDGRLSDDEFEVRSIVNHRAA
jgi:hypothetical protein